MKPDSILGNVVEELANALEQAIRLIYDMSIRDVVVPYDTIYRWEDLIKYARKLSKVK